MGMPSWLENIVFYEIYPQTFLDTDGDGIGIFRESSANWIISRT